MAQYEIILKNQAQQSQASPISGNTAETKQAPEKVPGVNAPVPGGQTGAQAVGRVVSYGTAKSFVKQILQHRVNTVELRTGSAELQQRISFAYQMGGQAVSVIESLALGAMAGGVPGAVIGAAISLGQTALSYVQNAQIIRWQGEVETISNNMLNIRAGGQIQTYGESRERRQ